MTCSNCGDRVDKYKKFTVKKPEEQTRDANFAGASPAPQPSAAPQAPASSRPNPSMNPFEDIERMNSLSYDEIKDHTRKFKVYFEELAERQLLKMSQTVKQTFFEELIDVVNCDGISPAGATPDQAAAMAWKVIQRDDFRFLEDVYPGITDKLRKRQELFESWKIHL
jgi:hypothetical protein